MMNLAAAYVVVFAVSSFVGGAKGPPAQKLGLAEYIKAGYGGIKRDLLAAAERMPEADYAFKPSQMSEARTYAAVIGHTADAMFGACGRLKDVPNPRPSIEKTQTAKAEIVKALADAFAVCDDVFSSLTDETGEEYVRQGPVEIPRAAALMGILAHNAEMYGISTVYLRARNLVPPGSERR
jgi:DinB superfamily